MLYLAHGCTIHITIRSLVLHKRDEVADVSVYKNKIASINLQCFPLSSPLILTSNALYVHWLFFSLCYTTQLLTLGSFDYKSDVEQPYLVIYQNLNCS